MEILEFREYYINEINAQAIEESRHKEDVYIENITDILINDYSMLSDLEQCYFDYNKGNRAFKNMHIDAGAVDLTTNTISLLFVDYNEDEMTDLNNAFINSKSQLLINYFENCLKGFFNGGEQANTAVQLAIDIRKNIDSVYKVHLYIASTNKLKESIKTIDLPNFIYLGKSYKVELDIIDMVKVYNTKLATFKKEDILIDVKDFGIDGIPCIKADINSDIYEAYLAVVPGTFLSDIYKKYGAQLLSGNVRSFLQVRGAVNKGIRATILNEKDKFFTYNNGISTTAKAISVEQVEGKGLCIKCFQDFQIINGGQTTASLASSSIKDNADLSGVYVQMKLTLVKEHDVEIIRNISKYANSQNAVKATDLNSNHPFYSRIEEFSRRIYAPTINNQTYQTIWFFERSRGQYDQPKMKMTKGEIVRYERINPKNQKFTKTDLAKWINSADMKPFDVAWGAEVNAIRFQNDLEKNWDKENAVYNEMYFRELVAKGILFKTIEKMISVQDWYKENKANRAQLVTYTIAKLISEIRKINKFFNYYYIWDKQMIPEYVIDDLAIISKNVFDVFNDPKRPYSDIREYCKRPVCWDNVKTSTFEFSVETISFLKEESEIKVEKIQAKKEQRFTNSLTNEIQIFDVGAATWRRMMQMGTEQKILTPQEQLDIQYAIDYCNGLKQLTPHKAKLICEIKAKLDKNKINI